MEKIVVDRAHIESLSFSDLVTLADEYGIDVPEDLDRQFLIAELIEVIQESGSADDGMLVSVPFAEGEFVLPKNYNETQISAVLRNPAWAFVFWNISDADKSMIKKRGCSLSLRICSYESASDPAEEKKPVSSFEIQNLGSSQEQYVLLPTDTPFVRIELVYENSSTGKVLAASSVIEIPQGASFLNSIRPGQEPEVSEIVKLSGFNDILTHHYENHRQSFS
ncbi:MAG: DUF4912 domain-containing protein [Treponema sp.]|nr:DUF4912 domain-containing protein [Treponema sp.]